MSEKEIAGLSLDDKSKSPAAAPAPAAGQPFQFNFAAAPAPAGGAAPAAAPFQFNFSAGGAPAPFSFDPKAKGESGAELAEPDDDDDEDDDALIKAAMEGMEPWTKVRVLNLLAVSKVRDQLRAEYRAEVRELLRKYEKLAEPLDAKRAAIVSGAPIVANPSAEAAASLAKLGEDGASKPIERFWLQAIEHSGRLASLVHEQDEPVLEHLVDVRSKSLEEGIGFRLEFEFSANPFFTNTVLTKTYFEEDGEDPILVKVEGCEINWNEGKNTTIKMVKKKQKSGKGGKNKKVVMKAEKQESFFNFFSPVAVPTEEDAKTLEEEEYREKEYEAEEDYSAALYFRDALVPDAVSFYLGVADEDEEEGGWNFGEGEDEEEDDEGHDDEDEDDDDDEHPAKRGGGGGGRNRGAPGGGKGGRGGGRGGAPPPECKQQ